MPKFMDLLTRAAVPKAGLGNLLIQPKAVGAGRVAAGTSPITYVAQGQPLNIDWNAEEMSVNGFLGNIYVMRCVRLIAETIAELPWVAGLDPTIPADYTKDAPLARLLGPATPQAPGGPNPVTSARAMWIWTICQYLVTGRFGWECQLDGPGKNADIIGLWPLVSSALAPKPSLGGTQWFDGYEYTPATGVIELKNEQVIYCWRPSIQDWRLPESVLQAATFPVFIANAVNKYIANLLKNDLVATTMVVTPPFEEAAHRRAWQDQFLSEFTGVDRMGQTIFAEVEADEDDPSAKPLVQVERLAQTVIEAGLTEAQTTANNDVCIALGVPRSLIGDASQRTYANADSEYKNFWTLTVLNIISELQDHINLQLAPRLGVEVGWFDLSRVAALQPPSVFAPPMITDVISTGVADVQQVANVLGIPPADATTDSDTDTVAIGQESATPSPSGGARSEWQRQLERRWLEWQVNGRPKAINTWSLRGLAKPEQPTRERIKVTTPKKKLSTRGKGIDLACKIIEQVEATRALMTADKTTNTVHQNLAENYPESTLGWVDDADWSGPQSIPLDDVQMARRPGGRDLDKVAGIAKGIIAGSDGANAPVVLVKTPGSDKLKIADGYHRTLAHKRVGHTNVPAYVGIVDSDSGPWDTDMHDQKLNRWTSSGLTVREESELEALADILAAV